MLPSNRRTPFVLGSVALYAAAIYLPFLGSAHVLSEHEGFIATTAQRMVGGESWLIPQYGNWSRIEKPPAYNWICAALFRLVGRMSETAERLPAALSAIGLCVLVAVIALRFFDERTALLAGLIQATCVWAYLQGRLGENDMPLTLLVAIAHAALLWHWGRGEDRLSLAVAIVFHSAIGLTAMFKGAAALPFPAMTVLSWCLVRRSIRPLLSVVATPAVLCFFAIAAPWHLYVWSQLGHEALQRWGYNAAGRVTGDTHFESQPIWFYLYQIPWLMLPWTIALVVNARVLVRDAMRPDGRVERFCWAWFFGGLVFLSVVAFKHKHYCMPVLPPLSILAATLVARQVGTLGRRAWTVYGAVFVVALVSFNVASAVVYPRIDHWAGTMRFVRENTQRIPADAELYAVGLGNSPVYPYIARRYEYLDGIPSVALRPGRDIWILALRREMPQSPPWSVDSAVEEPRRAGHPDAERLVIARISR